MALLNQDLCRDEQIFFSWYFFWFWLTGPEKISVVQKNPEFQYSIQNWDFSEFPPKKLDTFGMLKYT